MSARAWLCALSVVALGAFPLLAQETPQPKKVRRGKVIQRAHDRALAEEDLTMLRMVVAPNDDTGEVCAVIEYDTGAVGVFVGDVTSDSFVVIHEDNQVLLLEALGRAKTRRDWRKPAPH